MAAAILEGGRLPSFRPWLTRDGSGSALARASAGFGFWVSGLVLVFHPRFSGSGLGLVSGSISSFGFHPWISNGVPK